MQICSQSDCDRKSFATGLCHTHYYRKRKGLPLESPVYDKASETLFDRFWRNAQSTDHGLLWRGIASHKYGTFAFHGKQYYAHRIAYELEYGAIPDGFQIDHRQECPRSCVTAAHLQALSPSVHSKLTWERGEAKGRGRTLCEMDGCERWVMSYGLCHMHSRRRKRTGDPTKPWSKVNNP